MAPSSFPTFPSWSSRSGNYHSTALRISYHTSLFSFSVYNSTSHSARFLLLHVADLTSDSALAMVGGLVTPPILLAGPAGANLGTDSQLYLVSACLIWCGVGTVIQVSRFRIAKTRYYFGTGLISVTGTSFAFTNVALSYLAQCYANGTCQYAADGKTKLVSPCVMYTPLSRG